MGGLVLVTREGARATILLLRLQRAVTWQLRFGRLIVRMRACVHNARGAAVASCSAGRCKIQCGTGEGCGCVYIHDEDRCICECFEAVGGIRGLQLNPTAKVTVSVSGLPLGQVATMFDRILARDVMLPAARAQKKVRLKMENVRLSDALRALGLSTQRPASTPRRGAATGRKR